ncbi:MAG: hypothetical protein WCI04_01815 [archaeon]
MDILLLDIFTEFAKGVSFTLPTQTALTTGLLSNPSVLIAGIVLIVISLVIFFFLKKIIEHAIIGGIAWAIAIFAFHIPLPLIPSFAVAIIFGPAGIGVMLLLKFFGLI